MQTINKKMQMRAEMLMAMDCLMHHLRDNEDRQQWVMNALREGLRRDILNYADNAPEIRALQYMSAAESMTDDQFMCVIYTFADIIRSQCFSSTFNPSAFATDVGDVST